MLDAWRKKINVQTFSLKDEKPESFVTCQWQTNDDSPSLSYAAYRWVVAIYFLVTWSLSIILVRSEADGYRAKWLIYLTNWGYTTCTFQAFLAAFMVSACVLSKCPNMRQKFLGLYKIYWVANTTGTILALEITTIYWAFIYNPKIYNLDAMNFFLHAMNSVVMMLDFWMVSHPVKFGHFVYPAAFATIYAIFSFIYFLFGGTSREGTTYIYPILRWDAPSRTILVCACVGMFIVIIHTFFYFMYCLKVKLCEMMTTSKTIELTTVSDEKNQGGYVNEAVVVDQV